MLTAGDKKVRSETFVSRETNEPLRTYSASIKKWTDKINLIARKDANDEAIWERHILDSRQIVPLIPAGVTRAIDLGSGAGLPGMVVAIERPDIHVSMIEADRRKAAFLQTMVATLGLSATVVAERIEMARIAPVALVMARALAPLPDLLVYAVPLLAPGGVCLFMKGRNAEAEIAAAAADWRMVVERFASQTDPDAMILRISEVRRAG
ncbi:16S rRNA (guanine(527)-N(7))-methyltransferase RsmG [Acidiphilium sp. PA]|uniref:16S rRNA (guanine(527)-N(7))-methyltransferase RsmG n=1 Tax=Acidiphilium sp. PA TaxID=2871705 RepID=UPI002243222A|nr:16S rRNA (guanine(527)-N(7))-methyltransferase RsmG [Acidiphilium sp. PA]MCW8307807.1 16S rRNA (guanine(527)-N(7))-methyltransferase RsmG [Acidiphilium sp. PA]